MLSSSSLKIDISLWRERGWPVMCLFTHPGCWCQSTPGRQSSAPYITLFIRAYGLPRDWSPAASYGSE